MRWAAWLAAAWLLLAAAPRRSAAVPLSDWIEGFATNYGGPLDGMSPYSPSFGTKDGACGYGVLDKNSYPFWSCAALSLSNKFSIAGPAFACGECFEIRCSDTGTYPGHCRQGANRTTVTVTITDTCPECEADHIDIQALTFDKLAPMAAGRISMQYRRTECTPPEKLKVQIDGDSGVGGWLRLNVQKTAGTGGIAAVQMKGSNTGWMSLTNRWGSSWETANTPNLPWDFRFVSDDKQEVTAFNLVSSSGLTGDVPTNVQFALRDALNKANNGGGGPCLCDDTPPDDSHSCAEQRAFGKCNTGFMTDTSKSPSGFCAQTCGRCSCRGATSSPTPGTCNTPCSDEAPDTKWTCSEQQKIGQCNAPWMLDTARSPYGFCAQTCGRCPTACAAVQDAKRSCTDIAPDNSLSCAQQAGMGKCTAAWMLDTKQSEFGFCAATCKRCKNSTVGVEDSRTALAPGAPSAILAPVQAPGAAVPAAAGLANSPTEFAGHPVLGPLPGAPSTVAAAPAAPAAPAPPVNGSTWASWTRTAETPAACPAACDDKSPGIATCGTLKYYKLCDEAYMTNTTGHAYGYCSWTCGRCPLDCYTS